ncbi:hypothetical protein L9F63_026371, partial [Diploptera punctata]
LLALELLGSTLYLSLCYPFDNSFLCIHFLSDIFKILDELLLQYYLKNNRHL